MSRPITLNSLSLIFPHKTCFEGLSAQIPAGSRIGIVGRNGSGKSTLLKIIQGLVQPSVGHVAVPAGTVFGYVPQVVETGDALSGGQRVVERLMQELRKEPDVLCLDEPTNHLDGTNRALLMRLLGRFEGTLLVVSHDVELLRTCVSEIWLIDDGKVQFFSGGYDAFVIERGAAQRQSVERVEQLRKQHKKAQVAAQYEQQRAARSKRANKNENDRNLIERMKETASHTAGKKKGKINELQGQIQQALQESRLPEVITPKFNFTARELAQFKAIVSITDGSCGYEKPVLTNISLQLGAAERIAITGANGSGKTTLVKAIMGDPAVTRSGTWVVPAPHDIGYLDQHYGTLNPEDTVFDTIKNCVPNWTTVQVRKHLNDFLFRKNEEVDARVKTLSGGEKARLSLAKIAAESPKLLILDEVTNNLDLETREHLIEVLLNYPGAMIVVSHDKDFIERLDATIEVLS